MDGYGGGLGEVWGSVAFDAAVLGIGTGMKDGGITVSNAMNKLISELFLL